MKATVLLSILLLLSQLLPLQASPEQRGKLVVCITTKGQFQGETDFVGLRALAGAAHKYGFPVTWFLKPRQAVEAQADLKEWHEKYGDEVGWYAEGVGATKRQEEFAQLQEAVQWQKIRSAAHVKYGEDWVQCFEKNGITSVWGRCFEQTFADGIADRGCPHGFYYLRPEVYKAPLDKPGLVSVPWLSNDLNLVYRLGWQSSYTFDPDDVLSIGGIRSDNIEYWKALVDEYVKQEAFNPIVPLIVQQEYPSVGKSLRAGPSESLEALERLFAYLKENNIAVLPQAAAVDRYREAAPAGTPPTYALFNNLGNQPLVRNPQENPKFGKLHKIRTVTERITKAAMGPSYNGYYANDRPPGSDRIVYSQDGKQFFERGQLFVYYDTNGMLMFDEGQSVPERITNYFEIPADSYRAVVLPEMSQWYDTAKFIPKATIEQQTTPQGLRVTVKVPAVESNLVTHSKLAYGVMLWGDHSSLKVPEGAPVGTKVIGQQGLFIPVLLTIGEPSEVTLFFDRNQ